jgi:hypothetical protein
MKYTPETLLQIFMNGSLTEEAQKSFDQLMRDDPQFSEKVTTAMAERMGPIPDDTVQSISARLDSKVESIWVKNQPSKMTPFLRMAIKGILVLGLLGISIYVLWPKLLSILPQIDLSASDSFNTQTPQASMAPPAIIAPSSGYVEKAVPVKKIKFTPTVSNSSATTQMGDSMRTVIDIDKTESVQITVLNPNGILVRHLYQGIWTAGSHFVDWNGKDDLGYSVASGNYTVEVQAGSKKMSGVVTIKPN